MKDALDEMLRRSMEYRLPLNDEEREYFIGRFGQAPIRLRIQGVPLCMWCGVPVTSPSCDGPLVCALCDMGRNADGSQWTEADDRRRREHGVEYIKRYRVPENEAAPAQPKPDGG